MDTKMVEQNSSSLNSYIHRTEQKIKGLDNLLKRILTNHNYLVYESLVSEIDRGIFKSKVHQPHFSWWWHVLHVSIRSKSIERVNTWFEYATWLLNDQTANKLKSANGKVILNNNIYFVDEKYITLDEVKKYKSIEFPQLNYSLKMGLREDPWLKMFIERINEKQPIDPYPLDLVEVLEYSEENVQYINDSLSLINESAPELIEDITNFVKIITLVKCKFISNFTDNTMNGVIFLGESVAPFSDLYLTAEHIIHEAAHIKLNHILWEEKVITAPNGYVVDSPFRKDKRPLEGLLHAVYVYEKICTFWHSLKHKNVGDLEKVTNRLAEVSRLLEKGVLELNRHRHHFSTKGNLLLNSIESSLGGMKYENS